MATAVAAGSGAAIAQVSWPGKKPIRIVVPYPPGGTNDVAARILADRFTKSLGHAVLVENHPGGAGVIGMEIVAKSPPDGHTLAVVSDNVTLLDATRNDLPWSFERDFQPLAMIGSQPIVIATHPAAGFHSLQELVAAAKARPGAISCATSGQGTLHHLVAEEFAQRAGLTLTYVPYKGGGQAIVDLVGGQVAIGVFSLVPVSSYAKSGKLRVLAVSTASRHSGLPAVPTLDESGLRGFDVTLWNGLIAPAGVRREVIARIRDETADALADADVRKRLVNAGLDASAGMSGEEFEGYVARERARWTKLIEALGLTRD